QPLSPPAPIHSIAARYYSQDVQPVCRHSRFSTQPVAIALAPRVCAVKTEPASPMAKRWALRLALAEQQSAKRKAQTKAREDRRDEIEWIETWPKCCDITFPQQSSNYFSLLKDIS